MSSPELICPSSRNAGAYNVEYNKWNRMKANFGSRRCSATSQFTSKARKALGQSIDAVDREQKPSMTLRSSPTFPKGAHLSAIAIVGFLLYASFFVYRTSFVVGKERYFSLFDDPMISMRYAKESRSRLRSGMESRKHSSRGLYKSSLGLIHVPDSSVSPLPLSTTSLVVQIAATAFLAINLYYVRKIALEISEGSEAVALGAIALTALYLPINNWSL